MQNKPKRNLLFAVRNVAKMKLLLGLRSRSKITIESKIEETRQSTKNWI